MVSFLKFSPLLVMQLYFIVVLMSLSLMISDNEHYFMCMFPVITGSCIYPKFACFLNWVFVYL